MVSREVISRARKRIMIQARYDRQDLCRVDNRYENARKDWTPRQIRRMRKRFNQHGLGRFRYVSH